MKKRILFKMLTEHGCSASAIRNEVITEQSLIDLGGLQNVYCDMGRRRVGKKLKYD
jgi:hypothetical protein